MTASALAGELGIPLLAVQLHAVITKFMGETAAKLHLIFEAMQRTRGVYLFDEFDAIGRAVIGRTTSARCGVVPNSFLQFLEQDDSNSVIIAATNHAEKLDTALFRRFDDVVRYELPSPELAIKLIKNRLGLFGVDSLKWEEILSAAEAQLRGAVPRLRRRREEGHSLESHGNQHREPSVVDTRPTCDQRAVGNHYENGGWSWTAPKKLRHLRIDGRANTELFVSPRTGAREFKMPPLRPGSRMERADRPARRRGSAGAPEDHEAAEATPTGIVLVFKSEPDFELALKSPRGRSARDRTPERAGRRGYCCRSLHPQRQAHLLQEQVREVSHRGYRQA